MAFELQPFAGGNPEAELGASPEHIVGGLCPFLAHEIIDLALTQATEGLAHFSKRTCSRHQLVGTRAILAIEPARIAKLEKRVALGKIGGAPFDLIEAEIAPGQRRWTCPCRADTRHNAGEFVHDCLGESAEGGDLAAEDRQ